MADFTDRYNTKLSESDEKLYQLWLKTLPKEQQNTYDYDMRGAWQAGKGATDILLIGLKSRIIPRSATRVFTTEPTGNMAAIGSTSWDAMYSFLQRPIWHRMILNGCESILQK